MHDFYIFHDIFIVVFNTEHYDSKAQTDMQGS